MSYSNIFLPNKGPYIFYDLFLINNNMRSKWPKGPSLMESFIGGMIYTEMGWYMFWHYLIVCHPTFSYISWNWQITLITFLWQLITHTSAAFYHSNSLETWRRESKKIFIMSTDGTKHLASVYFIRLKVMWLLMLIQLPELRH